MPIDPWLPTGAEVLSSTVRPASGPEPPACSFSLPVCVHRAPDVAERTAQLALEELEHAYHRLVLALRLPAPLPDGGRGGTDGLDCYLNMGESVVLRVGHDPPEPAPFDRASAFCTVQAPHRAPLARTATQCVGEAIALRLDAAESAHARRSFATHLWFEAASPDSGDLLAIDDLQVRPQAGIAHSDVSRMAEGSAIFLQFLEAALGPAKIGSISPGLYSLAAGKTAPESLTWNNEPDLFDVLRHALKLKPRRMAKLMADFALARAFLGDREDGTHLPRLAWTEAMGRVRFDWVVSFSSLPRRVAPAYPLQPTGSTYVWLDLEGAQDATLAVQVEWEAPAQFSWVVAKVDGSGRELSRVYLPFVERGTRVEQRLVNLSEARGLIVAGINLGGVDPSHPFDPDVVPFEPHSCTVYLVRL